MTNEEMHFRILGLENRLADVKRELKTTETLDIAESLALISFDMLTLAGELGYEWELIDGVVVKR